MKSKVAIVLVLLALSHRLGAAGEAPRAAQQTESPAASDNAELALLFHDDQSDRQTPSGKAIDWKIVGPRDKARQARVKELYKSDLLLTGDDYYHAAMVLQHGEEPEDFLLCHELCVAAIINGNKNARWLAAASEDRFLMNIDRPQRFGTQFRSIGDSPMTLYKTDDGVTDTLRKPFGVPTLAKARERAMRISETWKSQNQPPLPTPAVVTPVAKAPVAPPSGAAGR
jgi:hypothetical protein